MSVGKTLFAKGGAKTPSVPEVISAFLGKETLFEGKMTFQGVFRLDGRFKGEIFESGTLVVGESAVVIGKIAVSTMIINGRVEGEVTAKDRVEIHPTGIFSGTLIAPVLTINEGGILNGYCNMGGDVSREEGLHSHSANIDHSLPV
jgi:cytoskeletal protein CcmA (bactofilin family)